MDLIYGIIYGILAQILTFFQLQGNVKWNLYERYPIIVLLSAIPTTWLFIKSVYHIVLAFDGDLWPSRLIGFGIGVIVFTLMSYLLFNETINLKTLISLFLSIVIILIQLHK